MHPSDPPNQHGAAAAFGKLVGMRLLELDDVLPQLVDAALESGWRGDVVGLRIRLAWTLLDAARTWESQRVKCVWAIRRRVRPMFEDWAEQSTIRRAAFVECAAWDDPLVTHEVMDLLRDEAARVLWWARTRRRHA